jgi:isocitrate dehydrogenase (NAD+)
VPRPGDDTSRPVTPITGDGIGALVISSPEPCSRSWSSPLYFQTYHVHRDMPTVPPRGHRLHSPMVCLKGEEEQPDPHGFARLQKLLLTRCVRRTAVRRRG